MATKIEAQPVALHNVSRETPRALRDALAATLEGEVRFDTVSRALYATDASVYQIIPAGVVIPKSRDDVVCTVALCARHACPITARGGGTSQAGQAIGPGVVIDLSKYLNRILEINPRQKWARVEPGVVLDELNTELKPIGLQFAPDVSTANRATLGGMMANNSSGAHSIVYGKTIDHVLEQTVVLSDGSTVHFAPLTEDEWQSKCTLETLEGDCYRTLSKLTEQHADEVERRYPKILRRVGGYNLDAFVRWDPKPRTLVPLMVGSEGTLGIVVEAKIQLVELPKAKALCVVHFNDLLDALAATPRILRHNPSAVEVVDKMILDSTKLNIAYARLRGFLHGDPEAVLIVEFFGDSAEELVPRMDALEAELRDAGVGYHVHRATDPAEQKRIWELRKAALGLSMRQRGDAKAISFVEDTAVPPEHLRDYIDRFLMIVADHGTTAGVYAHASVGCLHVRPVINLKTEAGVGQFQSIAEQVAELVLEYGGAVCGEHGDGLVRSGFQEKMFGPELYQAFRELKRAFDPQGILNPGKIVDAPPMTEHLRYGAGYATPDVPTRLDFSADGGLARSAELCSGVGACRKKREGTMCPSYMATREEKHSTRGRANTLRLAISGQLGPAGLSEPELYDVLDLCLECKACTSECPVGVDMAKLKYEFLSQYRRVHGTPLRARLLGNVDRMARWGSRFAPVSNWMLRSRPVRWAQQGLFGLDRRRMAPGFARQTFERWFERRRITVDAESRATVALFVDTFMNYYEPEIGIAAVELLEQTGQQVQVPSRRCCGRPMISQGMLDQAAEHARYNVKQLLPLAEQGMPIIGCEPSCLLTLRSDYPDLVGSAWRQQAELVASACQTFEEFYLSVMNPSSRERQRAGVPVDVSVRERVDQTSDPLAGARGYGVRLRFRERSGRVLVHGHCHQKALVGMEATMALLKRVPTCEVADIAAGCCGMAGSFGYEREHYGLSEEIANLRLVPALSEDPDATVIAPGFSCRHQIAQFAGRRALHPAVWLRELVEEPRSQGVEEARS
jgi:FAD/FMN-containing dehydrogenase/Fe-S oxidoreductase